MEEDLRRGQDSDGGVAPVNNNNNNDNNKTKQTAPEEPGLMCI
jgi:hypothetical protein